MSIYDNIAYGPRTHGIRSKAKLDVIVEKSLRQAAIWDEVKDRLKRVRWAFPAVSSSAYVLQELWQWNRRFCLWTSRPARWTRSPHRRSKTLPWS